MGDNLAENCVAFEEDVGFAPKEQEVLQFSGLVVGVVSILFIPACFVYFLLNRAKYERLRKRNVPLLVFFAFGSIWTCGFTFGLRFFFKTENFGCDFIFVMTVLALLSALNAVLTRTLMLFFRVTFNRKLISATFKGLMDGTVALNEETRDLQRVVDSNHSGTFDSSYGVLMKDVPFEILPDGSENRETGDFSSKKKKIGGCSKFMIEFLGFFFDWSKKRKVLPEEIQLLAILSTTAFSIVFFLIMSLFAGGVSFFAYDQFINVSGCKGCNPADLVLPLQFLFAMAFMFAIVVVALSWDIPDNLGVKADVKYFIGFFIFLLFFNYGLRAVFPKPEEDGVLSWAFFGVLGVLIGNFYVFIYQVHISKKKVKRVTKATDKTNKSLKDVLQDSNSSKAYALFLATELSLENLYFLKTVERWKVHYERSSKAERKKSGQEIFDNFIEEDSAFQINISGTMKMDLKEAFEDEVGGEVFDEATNEIYKIMAFGSFQRFKRSKYFKALDNILTPTEVVNVEDI